MISGGRRPTATTNSAISKNASRNPPSQNPAVITSGKIIIPLRVPTIVRPIAEPRRWMNQLAITTTTAMSITATVIPRPTPQSSRNCHRLSIKPSAAITPATRPTETNNSMRGPCRSAIGPTNVASTPPPMPPITIVSAIEAVLQPYSACNSGVNAPSTGLKNDTAANDDIDAAAAIHHPAKTRRNGLEYRRPGRRWRRRSGSSSRDGSGMLMNATTLPPDERSNPTRRRHVPLIAAHRRDNRAL